jgi:CheY-like chemotaxis protein
VVVNAASPQEMWQLVDRARCDMPATPIIGCAVPYPMERAMAAGIAGYLIKPLTRAKLADAVGGVGDSMHRVLVVDDDRDALQMMTVLLQTTDNSLEVQSAESGPEALGILRGWHPDLMLLDILMPEMSGWQVLEAKTQDEDISDIPVILVSAQDPKDKPVLSQLVVAAMGEGLPLNKVLLCSQYLPQLLMQPD